MPLTERLRGRIEREGPLRVRDFMEIALYDAQEGYYAKGPEIGAKGDFYTASNASLFPHALSRFVQAALERMGGARVVELGGGRGELAASLGHNVTIIEPSAGLATAQQARGLEVVASLAELKPASTLFVANEVLDALPVHRILMTAEGAREGYVAWENGRFVERAGALSDPRLAAAAARLALAPGQRAEVNLAAGDLLDAMQRAAPRMAALFLDYGGAPASLYGEGREGGTLRGFRQHRVTDALEAPGEQDVTADVDFGWVASLARERGLDVLGERTQGEFLADLGLLDDMMAALQKGDLDAYAAGKNLLMPTGMGERFRVLLVGRGVAATPPLPGFRRDLFPGASRR